MKVKVRDRKGRVLTSEGCDLDMRSGGMLSLS